LAPCLLLPHFFDVRRIKAIFLLRVHYLLNIRPKSSLKLLRYISIRKIFTELCVSFVLHENLRFLKNFYILIRVKNFFLDETTAKLNTRQNSFSFFSFFSFFLTIKYSYLQQNVEDFGPMFFLGFFILQNLCPFISV